MFGLGNTRTTTTTRTTHAHPHRETAHAHAHAHSYPKESKRANRIIGLKAAINNPRTTEDGRDGAEAQLRSMGVKPNKPTLGTRIRHLFGLPGRSSHRRTHARSV